MATEYVVNKNKTGELGIIGLSTTVFETIARAALDETPKVRVAPRRSWRKSVSSKVVNHTIYINAKVLAKHDADINLACKQAQHKIQEAITQMTEIKDIVVDINIVGFYF